MGWWWGHGGDGGWDPLSVFIMSGPEERLKVGDFGLAQNMIRGKCLSHVGTPCYMSPGALLCPQKAASAVPDHSHPTYTSHFSLYLQPLCLLSHFTRGKCEIWTVRKFVPCSLPPPTMPYLSAVSLGPDVSP